MACRGSVASNKSAFGRRLVPDQNDAPFAVLDSGGFARSRFSGSRLNIRSNDSKPHSTHARRKPSPPSRVERPFVNADDARQTAITNACASSSHEAFMDAPARCRKKASRSGRFPTASFSFSFPFSSSSRAANDVQASAHSRTRVGISTNALLKRSRAHCAQCGNVCGKFPTTQDGNEGSERSNAPETDQGAVTSFAATYAEYEWFSTPTSIRLNR